MYCKVTSFLFNYIIFFVLNEISLIVDDTASIIDTFITIRMNIVLRYDRYSSSFEQYDILHVVCLWKHIDRLHLGYAIRAVEEH